MTLRVTQSSRRLRTAAIGVGIVLFDLTLMFANHDVWRGVKSKNARLAFIEKSTRQYQLIRRSSLLPKLTTLLS